jgi:hypothetical protein
MAGVFINSRCERGSRAKGTVVCNVQGSSPRPFTDVRARSGPRARLSFHVVKHREKELQATIHQLQSSLGSLQHELTSCREAHVALRQECELRGLDVGQGTKAELSETSPPVEVRLQLLSARRRFYCPECPHHRQQDFARQFQN